MNILLSNDDGIHAQGLLNLKENLINAGHTVYIVAPEYEQSAKSHAISTRVPIRILRYNNNTFSVDGTPSDCIIMAFEHIIKEYFSAINIDLVVSGINAGQNLGDDILYSGTVAAAVEASLYGCKALAISITSYFDYKFDTASKVLLKLLKNGIMDFIGYREIININVPNVSIEEIMGITTCQAGFRRYQNIVHKQNDPRGNDIFWLGGERPLIDKSNYEIDIHAIKENKVSISPLKIDSNDYKKIESLNDRMFKVFEK